MKIHPHECSGCKKTFDCDREDCGGRLYQHFSSCNECMYARMQALPRKALALVVILGLLMMPVWTARAQEIHRPHVPEHASVAVFEQTQRSIKRLQTKQALGQDTAVDYAIAGANFRVMFAHMDETGMTDSAEKYILANPSRFLDYPSEPELQPIFAKLTVQEREGFVQFIRSNGLKALHEQIASTFEQKALAMVQQGHAQSAAYTGGARLMLAQCAGDGRVHLYIGWASFYLGIVGAVLGGPIGTAIFVIGIATSYMDMVVIPNNC